MLDSSQISHLEWIEQDAVRWIQGLMPRSLRDRLPRFGRNLNHLRVYGPDLVELGALGALPGTLVELRLQGTSLETLQGLPDTLPRLQTLTVQGNSSLASLAGLPGELPGLLTLTLQGNDSLTSLDGLPEGLPELQTFGVAQEIRNLSTFPRMPKLETLDLANTQIEDIEDLHERCPNLVSLDIRGTRVKSLKGIPASVRVLYVGDRVSDAE